MERGSSRIGSAADPPELPVGVVEEGLQLLDTKRPLRRVGLGVLDVPRGVPLMENLHRRVLNRAWHSAAHP